MTPRSPSWQALATLLADRLSSVYCEQHRTYTLDCPYCEDVRAWETWAIKAGATRPVLSGTSVALPDVPANTTLRLGSRDY